MIEVKHSSVVLREFRTEGHQPLQVITNDGQVFVAKSGKGQHPPISLINEFLCASLLRIWRLKTPDFAAIDVDPSTIDISLATVNRPSHYASPCFGSKWLPEAIEVNALINSKENWKFKKLGSPVDLWRIGLFDMWVENDDRKPMNPNLLMKESKELGKFEVYAIDHAYTFMSTSYDVLDPSYGVSQSYNDSILNAEVVKNLRKHLTRREVANLRSDYFEDIAHCKEKFYSIAGSIPNKFGFHSKMQEQVFVFLFSEERNQVVFDQFLQRI